MSFDFDKLDPNQGSAARRVRGRRKRQSPLVLGIVIASVCALIVLGLAFWLGNQAPSLALKSVQDRRIDELGTLRFTASIQDSGRTPRKLEYALHDAPQGARIDRESGQFTWSPSEEQGPGHYEMTISVAVPGGNQSRARRTFSVQVNEVDRPPVIEKIDRQAINTGEELKLEIQARDPDIPSRPLKFSLAPDAPAGAKLDPVSGEFSWTPQDGGPDELHQITVRVEEAVAGGETSKLTFQVRLLSSAPVAEAPEVMIDRFVAALRDADAEVAVSEDNPPHPPLSGKLRVLSVSGQTVGVFGYGSAEAARADIQGLAPDDLEQYTLVDDTQSTAHLFQRDHVAVFYVGRDATMLNLLDNQLGRPVVVKSVDPMSLAETEPAEPEPEPDGDDVILALHNDKKLLLKPMYPTLRKVYSDRFEEQRAEEISQAFGDEESSMRRWLEQRRDIKEEFYLAIDPEHDNVPKALSLFNELKDLFPNQFEAYANLAIAVSVVWDDEKGAIHGSPTGQHHSTMPDGQLGSLENFKYFLDAQNFMQGRARFLPWEFLVHVVNHRTPLAERQWALANYLPKRVMFGKCYNDVPYDGDMLNGMEPKLANQLHTLPNIRMLGGVCSCRADYAARVGKSIGVPAFSVGGKSRFGEGHAWVMWVELGTVTQNGFAFSLQSDGRFRGDRYYVGDLHDPHTGLRTTDRELELRLHTVGMDPVAKRHADLVMRSYPMIRERTEIDTTEQLLFLSRVIDFSPGNEQAWITLAKMSREGQITKANSKPMLTVLNRLFTTFANLPDFTWVVFDDLVSFQDLPRQRAELFGRLAGLYEQAGRPDLSCQARIKFAEYLVADERREEAIQGLSVAILLFPEEGNFVPKMLDKMEELCGEVEGSQQYLVGFYQEFLPKISPKRGDRPSPYCIQMCERGIERFQAAGVLELAQAYQNQLAILRASE